MNIGKPVARLNGGGERNAEFALVRPLEKRTVRVGEQGRAYGHREVRGRSIASRRPSDRCMTGKGIRMRTIWRGVLAVTLAVAGIAQADCRFGNVPCERVEAALSSVVAGGELVFEMCP